MKFTIISINLNNKTGLVKTRDSISTQTFRDFEWIVIDGGSTDGSEEYIKENIQTKYPTGSARRTRAYTTP